MYIECTYTGIHSVLIVCTHLWNNTIVLHHANSLSLRETDVMVRAGLSCQMESDSSPFCSYHVRFIVNARRGHCVGLVLGKRCRRWPIIKPAQGQRLVLVWPENKVVYYHVFRLLWYQIESTLIPQSDAFHWFQGHTQWCNITRHLLSCCNAYATARAVARCNKMNTRSNE